MDQRNQDVIEGVRLILQGIGIRADDPNFIETPHRVLRLYRELLYRRRSDHKSFPGGKYGGMVVLRGHEVHGLCPHHLLPVIMKVYVGYIPREEVLGLSKLARVAEEPLTKPILQEEYTEAVAERFKIFKPKGVGVVVVGLHGCMRHRGIKTDADVVTSVMSGDFLMNPTIRQEFQHIIGKV